MTNQEGCGLRYGSGYGSTQKGSLRYGPVGGSTACTNWEEVAEHAGNTCVGHGLLYQVYLEDKPKGVLRQDAKSSWWRKDPVHNW